ncbi:MAG: hypothetical protein JW861_10130 [Bacteroidales bacterium]|nr:hypothetical protein [Bacteroidales bacterium]
MKNTGHLIALILMILAGLTAEAQVNSTTSGGPWNSGGTWVNGFIPGPGDDVIINGPVQVTFGAACNNITVMATGSLTSSSSASWTLTVNGSIINWGSITDNIPANTRLYINVYSDIENHGIWQNFGVYACGVTDSYIGADQPFEMKQFYNSKSTANILALSSLTFSTTLINFNFTNLTFVYGYELHLENAAELRDISLGESTTLYGDGTTLLYNVSASLISFNGAHNIGQGCSFNEAYNYGLLQNYPTATAGVISSGVLVNSGEIRDNPVFGDLLINFSGNLDNEGVWTNHQLNATGSADQFIWGANPFEVDYLDHNNTSGDIITLGNVTFRGTNLRFYGRNLVSGGLNPLTTLEGPGNAHEVNFLLGGYTLHPDGSYYFTYCTFDNANVEGILNLGNQCVFTGNLVNSGTVRNVEASSYTTQILCDVYNNGTISDHPGSGTLITELSGSVMSNSGTWSNQQIHLMSPGDQAIFASSPIAAPFFSSLKSSGKVMVYSNCEFSGTQIDMNNDTLILAEGITLSLINNTVVNEAVILSFFTSSGLYMDGLGYLSNCTLGLPTLYGTVQFANNVQVTGGLINYGTLQNDPSDDRTASIQGDVKNFGSIGNHAGGGSLTLEITGDISQQGTSWQNSQTRLTGSQDQYVFLMNNTDITSQIRLYSMITAGSYLWHRDNMALTGSDPLFSGHDNTILTFLQPVGSIYSGDYQCITGNGDSRHITIQDMYSELILNVIVFLQGPFSGSGMMSATLNTGGQLPLSQPYNLPPWNYTGTENVASMPSPDIVDWVLLELRDAPDAASATPATIIAQQAGLLRTDGAITGLDGISPLSFPGLSVAYNLFAVVWHRNHLGVMSAVPLIENSGVYSYDFTTSGTQAFGGTLAHKQVAPGVWGMIAADGSADGQVNNTDKNEVWAVQAGSTGYKAGDFNMDSQVNNTDKNDLWKPNTGLSSQVPPY